MRVDIHLFHHFLPIPVLLYSPIWVLEEGLKWKLLSAEVVEMVFLSLAFLPLLPK